MLEREGIERAESVGESLLVRPDSFLFATKVIFFVMSLNKAKRSSKKPQRANNSVRQRGPKPQTSGERGTTLETGRLRELHRIDMDRVWGDR